MFESPSPLNGRHTRAELEAYPGWERAWAEPYAANATQLAAIREHLAGVEVIVFTATWCPDCRREVPRFFAIADLAGLAEAQVTLVGLERTMRDSEGLAARWGVRAVPTFIFTRDGRELGRVVERPQTSLEADIARILARG